MTDREPPGRSGTGPAPELVNSAFELETSYARTLHDGLNLADLAHVLDLRERAVIPDGPCRRLLAALIEFDRTPVAEFPYDPADGEPYNSRERVLSSRIGDDAGWLHAGRPRREATRVAFRLYLRRALADLIDGVLSAVDSLVDQAAESAQVLFPDQTYLQQAQPSTVGHYLLSFAYPLTRDARRLADVLAWTNRSPGGAGCVNGNSLRSDREAFARRLGFEAVITHTRDAMWQTDGLVALLATLASLGTTEDSLAEDLEIWSSNEFDFVRVGDGYTRASVLMPQKRNPYALSIIRGSAGVLSGRLGGFLAVQKAPSARSDKLIFAYTEVPGAVDLAARIARLTAGVVASLEFNMEAMRRALDIGYSQATDLAEHLMEQCTMDYRSAYRVVGAAVQDLASSGRQVTELTVADLSSAASRLGRGPVDLDEASLREILDPARIVATRTATGGTAVAPVAAMVDEVHGQVAELRKLKEEAMSTFDSAEVAVRRAALQLAEGVRA